MLAQSLTKLNKYNTYCISGHPGGQSLGHTSYTGMVWDFVDLFFLLFLVLARGVGSLLPVRVGSREKDQEDLECSL